MCRLAAYLGEEITLRQFLHEPEHNLIKQSWAPNEMQDGTLNADGFGITWLSKNNILCTYKNILPIWSDNNLEGLSHSLSSQIWLANVRSATPGQGINEANTQPFVKDNLVLTHNGCIKPFSKDIKTALLEILSSEVCAEINGDSDSLYLLALLLQNINNNNSIVESIQLTMSALKEVCGKETTALLNLIISDGKSLYACRHAINKSCPSLYYLFDDRGIQIASEPLTPENDWEKFNEHSLLVFNETTLLENHSL